MQDYERNSRLVNGVILRRDNASCQETLVVCAGVADEKERYRRPPSTILDKVWGEARNGANNDSLAVRSMNTYYDSIVMELASNKCAQRTSSK